MQSFWDVDPTKIEEVFLPSVIKCDVRLFIKRDDLIHPFVSGNKWRKLKYNLIEAKKRGFSQVLTFGGAFSNHIYSSAYAIEEAGMSSIGVIRGEELNTSNFTLNFASSHGMKFHFLDRSSYRNKYSFDVLSELKSIYGDFFLIPEGGSNEFAVEGVGEMLDELTDDYSHICCACGTGGTLAGIANKSTSQLIIGFPVLKNGEFLKADIDNLIDKDTDYHLACGYHFGGYAKINRDLVIFMDDFYAATNIQLDPVYTAKMMYGVIKEIENGNIPSGSRVLAIHTGGLQGLEGMRNKMDRLRG